MVRSKVRHVFQQESMAAHRVLRPWRALDCLPLGGLTSPTSCCVSVRCASKACYQDVVRKRQKGARKPSQRKVMIASQLLDTFAQHEMVVLYHYNSLNTQEWNGIRFKLSENGIRVKVFPSKISIKALKGTAYSNITPLFRGCTAVAYAREPTAVKELLAVTKSEDKLYLLGGVVEKQILTPVCLRDYAALPPLEVVQQAIVNTINQVPLTLIRYIESVPQRLSQLMAQIEKRDANET